MTPQQVVLILMVAGFTAIGLWTDMRHHKLPNILTVSAFGLGLLYHLITGWLERGLMGAGEHLLFSLGGFATGFGILFVLFLVGGGAGGDVKYMGAIGAWIGAWQVLCVVLVGAFLLVFCSFGVLIIQFLRLGFGKARERYLTPAEGKSERAKLRRGIIPFGIPATLATWLVVAFYALRQGGGV